MSQASELLDEIIKGIVEKREIEKKASTEPTKEECYFFDYYRDMGASCPICTLEKDLEKATRANCKNCKHYINKKQADKIIKKKVGL